MIQFKNEKIAIPVVLLAGLIWSFGPLVVRHMNDPNLVPWQYIFARGLTIFLILNLYLFFEEGKNFGSWLRGIARNKALMHWRSAAAKIPLSADPRSVEGIDEVFESIDRQGEEGDWWAGRREILNQCIKQLSENLRSAIQRVYSDGDTLDEAAAALGATRLAIGQRLSRARNQIRNCVALKLDTAKSHD